MQGFGVIGCRAYRVSGLGCRVASLEGVFGGRGLMCNRISVSPFGLGLSGSA